jgi:hypothetical protein
MHSHWFAQNHSRWATVHRHAEVTLSGCMLHTTPFKRLRSSAHGVGIPVLHRQSPSIRKDVAEIVRSVPSWAPLGPTFIGPAANSIKVMDACFPRRSFRFHVKWTPTMALPPQRPFPPSDSAMRRLQVELSSAISSENRLYDVAYAMPTYELYEKPPNSLRKAA